jgi:transposase-like protein
MTISVEVRCLDCDSPHVIRYGFAPHGVQRFRCRACARVFIVPADRRGYTAQFKEQVLAAYQERSSMRAISRTFGISRNTLVAWLKEKGGSCPS